MSDQPTAKVEVWREIDGAWKIVLMDIPHAHQVKNKIVPQTEKNTLFFL